jgi:NADH dehydrogenase
VIYCIGILRESRRRGITFEALQYEGLAATVDAATSAGVGRLLLMSANGVKIPGTLYQESKIRAEKVALTSGLKSTVFRPSVIFGDPRGKMEFASQLFRDMVAMPFPALGFFTGLNPTKGSVLMSPIHVRDVARAFCRALEDSATYGRVYDLGGPEALSWVEIIRRIAAATGRKKWILPFPLRIMKLAAWFFDWLPFFPITGDQLTMLAEGNVADPEMVISLIGESPSAFSVDNLRYLNRTTN